MTHWLAEINQVWGVLAMTLTSIVFSHSVGKTMSGYNKKDITTENKRLS